MNSTNIKDPKKIRFLFNKGVHFEIDKSDENY